MNFYHFLKRNAPTLVCLVTGVVALYLLNRVLSVVVAVLLLAWAKTEYAQQAAEWGHEVLKRKGTLNDDEAETVLRSALSSGMAHRQPPPKADGKGPPPQPRQ